MIVIARDGEPVALFVPLKTVSDRRQLGILAGKATVPPEFDAPLPGRILRALEGR